MKIKATADLWGLSYGVEDGLRRGEIYDLPTNLAAEAVRRGAAQLDLIGEPRRAGWLPSNEELVELAAALAAEQPVASPLADLRAKIGRGRNAG